MASTPTLDFERPIYELEKQIDELKKMAGDQQLRVDEEIAPLERKLTALRQSVFAEIAASHKAIGAYEVLARLADRGERLAPISVYRAIDALVEVGIVHRFESRNAFFACHSGHEERRQLVLACERCRSVAEIDGALVFSAIDRAAGQASFRARDAVVEVWGLCANCGSAAREPDNGRA